MPDVLKLPPQHMAWLHGQVRMLTLGGLHPGQLIQADRTFPLPGSFRSARIYRASLANLLAPLLIGDLGQPIAESVRLETPFLSNRAACRGEICSMMPRAITSAAISRPVH